MKKFTICMVSILMAIPLFAKTYSLQESISNGSAEICKKIDGNINTVVVVDVQSDSESLSDYIYSELNYNFVNNLKKTFVAERNEFTLSLIKKEFEYQNSGEVSDMTIQSVGNSLGADCVVLGKIEDSSTGWKFTLKAVQVETKKILSVWSGTISKNDKDVKFIVSKDNVDNTVNKKIENYEEKRIIRTEVFFPYTSNPWSEEWEYIYYENDKGKFYDSNSYPEYWQEKLIKPKLINTYFIENDNLTELQYAAKILQDYGTVFVICRAENEIRYFQAVKLEDSTIFVLYFSADGLNNGVSYVDLANKAYEEGDYKLAFEYFLKADEITDSYSQGNLGWLYQTGEGGFQNYAKAFDWYLKSAKQGDAFSQNKIGIFYFNGYGVNKSYKDAKIWYEKAAEQGNINAQTSLGYLYQYGYGVTKDLKKAKDLYNQSAVQGDPVAQYNLGVLYQNGFGVPVDYVEAIEWYEKAADQGYELAITALELCYALQTPEDRIKYCQKLAQKGDVDAMFELAELYDLLLDNMPLAIEWYKKAAEKGHLQAQLECGDYYQYEENYNEAIKWYKMAEMQGSLEAISALESLKDEYIALGKIAFDAKNYTEAFVYYKNAADMGNAYAQSWMGYFYRYGIGTKTNFTKAIEYFEKAANQGDSYSSRNLAENYEYGFGISVEDAPYGEAINFDKAFYWYKKAAEQGDVMSQVWLGSLYSITYHFFGIKKNIPEAKKWYEKASAQGDSYAKERLTELK